MELLKNLQWRYATKKFDPNKKVTDIDIEKLKQVVQLSVSSYGLQLYKILIVTDKEIRRKLLPVSWGQSQIVDASHLFVFCSYTEVKDKDIDNFISQTATTRNLEVAQLKGYGDFIKSKLNEKSESELSSWLKSQTYLALSSLLNACAELKIDACPMEGFDPIAYNKILDLDSKGLSASLVAPIGFRHIEDGTQELAKVRKPLELLFDEIK